MTSEHDRLLAEGPRVAPEPDFSDRVRPDAPARAQAPARGWKANPRILARLVPLIMIAPVLLIPKYAFWVVLPAVGVLALIRRRRREASK